MSSVITEARGLWELRGGPETSPGRQQASEGIRKEESEPAVGNGDKGVPAEWRPRAEQQAGGQNVGSVVAASLGVG